MTVGDFIRQQLEAQRGRMQALAAQTLSRRLSGDDYIAAQARYRQMMEDAGRLETELQKLGDDSYIDDDMEVDVIEQPVVSTKRRPRARPWGNG